ncbi:MAG: hypothetical protein ACYC27_02960 [Armatimonadota bacterium]
MLLVQEWLPGFLTELERNEITAGRYMAKRQLTYTQAELLRSPDLGFSVKLDYQGPSSRAHYIISWLPKKDEEDLINKAVEEVDQAVSEMINNEVKDETV